MSRAASGQLTTPSRHIYTTLVTQSDGTKTQLMSAQPLSDQSIRVNAHDYLVPLHLLMALMQSETPNPNPFILGVYRFAEFFRKLPVEILTHTFSYLLPINNTRELVGIGAYATALRKPILFSSKKIEPFFVVDAAMRGQEDIVLNILRVDPSYLLKKAKVNNSVDVEYEVTPLQAAIMTNDIQLIKRMKEHFERLTTDLAGNPIDGLVEMQQQIIAIYKESLKAYFQKREMEKLTTSGTAIDDAAESSIQVHFETDWQTVQQRGINAIIEEHNRVQAKNIFDFQP